MMKSSKLLLAALLLVACGPSTRRPPGGGGGGGGQCPAACKACDANKVCQDCLPGKPTCQGVEVHECNADGTIGNLIKTCDAANKQACTGGTCLSPCEVAASSRSYIGCDYWPTTTLTSQLNPYFDFAVAVANPAEGDVVGATANVTITRGGQVVAQKAVTAGTVETIILPWVKELTLQPDCGGLLGCTPKNEASTQLPDGAYHLVSDLPVTVYQFSPLQFEKPQNATCQDPLPMGNTCHSYTNDASLLLPTTVLRDEYIVISRQTFGVGRGGNTTPLPGFFAVIATEDGTKVDVSYSAFTEPGKSVAAKGPGQSAAYTLNAGEVLQVVSKRVSTPCAQTSSDAQATYCDMGPKYDLTGTRIKATKPVAVFGGHSCSFVPYNKYACDHLEEQLFPVETWGQKIIVAPTKQQTQGEPNTFRIVSGSDNNQLVFDPAVYKPTTLSAGQYVEFQTDKGFQVSGSGRVAVAQFMVGQNTTAKPPMVGDPAMGLGIPFEQYRSKYTFLTPTTYTKSYVNIIAPMGGQVVVDGQPVQQQFTTIGATGYGYTSLELKPGQHLATASQPFGITVSGIASYTSYLYPGGLDLKEIPRQ